ncbi:BTB and MATH domain-containing protein 38-like [Mercenaria mercenaria]|uniref:BTB and MATH domain-containing protein 38-like n=1 Tax=Mercenaria mercenaria TaxID=6596 RepID=UPI00234E9CA5|nr:BTB and MATH domain-containing protein 38-like [Mercenaria mercenaria]
MEDSDSSSRNNVEADGIENEDQEEGVENTKQTENKSSTFDFTEQSWRTDFVLIVEGTKLYVAKNILSLASPVFDTMFQSNFKESSCYELELPGKKLNDVIEFLRCIYPNTFTQMTRDSALKVLPLLEEYQVLQHKPRCETILLESVSAETGVAELIHLLQEACMYDLQKLREKCLSLSSEKPDEELGELLDKCSLPAEAAKEILQKVNKKLREVIASLKTSIEDVSEKTKENIEQLKTTNVELMEELDIMK